jgi:hypothetical protein
MTTFCFDVYIVNYSMDITLYVVIHSGVSIEAVNKVFRESIRWKAKNNVFQLNNFIKTYAN